MSFMSNTMKTIAMLRSIPISDPEALIEAEMPIPVPGAQDLLVRVKAVSINPVDVKVRTGAGVQQDPKILGWDAAGIVESVGENVSGFVPGDEVYYAGDLTRPGSNAEYQTVDYRIVAKNLHRWGSRKRLPFHLPQSLRGKRSLIIWVLPKILRVIFW